MSSPGAGDDREATRFRPPGTGGGGDWEEVSFLARETLARGNAPGGSVRCTGGQGSSKTWSICLSRRRHKGWLKRLRLDRTRGSAGGERAPDTGYGLLLLAMGHSEAVSKFSFRLPRGRGCFGSISGVFAGEE